MKTQGVAVTVTKNDSRWVPTILLMMLLWGLIALQRFAPGFMAPFIIDEFSLTNTQWGIVMGIFAFAWAAGSFTSGVITDRIGSRPMIVGPALFAALVGWATGIAQTFWQFFTVRIFLGLGEGAVWPALAKAATQIVPDDRRGIVVSLLSAAFLLLGMALGAPLMTHLGENLGWRWGFFVIALPLLITALLLNGLLKGILPQEKSTDNQQQLSIKKIVSNLNVLLCAAISVCMMARVYIIMSFGILFITEVHGMPTTESGIVLGLALLGDILGAVFMGRLADITGQRRLIVILSSFVACVAGTVFALLPVGTSSIVLLSVLFLSIFASGGLGPIVVVLIPSESVNENERAAAIGTTNSIGEMVGAGMFPIAGGVLADAVGLNSTMLLAAGIMGLACIFAFQLRSN